MVNKKPRVVDLFSGCGGMSLGFENAGFDVVAAFDNVYSFVAALYDLIVVPAAIPVPEIC